MFEFLCSLCVSRLMTCYYELQRRDSSAANFIFE